MKIACRLALGFLLLATAAAAQDSPALNLRKEGDAFIHDASKSRFTLPKDWEATKPDLVGSIAKLAIRLPEKSVEGTISWSPLIGKMDEAVDLEMIELTQKYGREKVTRKDPITVANKPVFVIAVDEGTARDVPNRQGKEAGMVYLFEGGADERSRWKIKLRGSFPKSIAADGQKLVEGLLQNFQW